MNFMIYVEISKKHVGKRDRPRRTEYVNKMSVLFDNKN